MNPAKRGDLAVVHVGERSADHYELAVVTSITRDGQVKAVRRITGRDAAAGTTAPTRLQAGRGATIVIPVAQFSVPEAIGAVLDHRATQAGDLPAYANPVDLLRDLHPWAIGDTTCLDHVRSIAYAFLRNGADQRCDDCGVTTYGDSRIDTSAAVPTVHCQPSCPVGVNYTTNYPVGLDVEVTGGFAAGATARIERVSDSYVADTPPDEAGTRYYSGRSYTVNLPGWGCRTLDESIFRPVDPQLRDRYTVRREVTSSS